jgi:hypothetical protein
MFMIVPMYSSHLTTNVSSACLIGVINRPDHPCVAYPEATSDATSGHRRGYPLWLMMKQYLWAVEDFEMSFIQL